MIACWITEYVKRPAVEQMVRALKDQGLTVFSFGPNGYSAELDGTQIFRATSQGNEVFEVKRMERVHHG